MTERKYPNAEAPSASDEDGIAENRLRLSLSRLGGTTAHRHTSGPGTKTQRRRFARDGDIPTVYTSRLPDRLHPTSDPAEDVSAAQVKLALERLARAEAEAALDHARISLKDLQTRLGHMELELREARERMEHVQRAARPIQKKNRAKKVENACIGETAHPVTARVPVKAEPEPVKWWLKSTKTRAPRKT